MSANQHHHTERNSVESTYLENTYPDQEQNGREERVQESAMIREQSSATDLQQSAEYTTTVMQWTINPCKTPDGHPQVTYSQTRKPLAA